MLDDRPDCYLQDIEVPFEESVLRVVADYLRQVGEDPLSEPVIAKPMRANTIRDALGNNEN